MGRGRPSEPRGGGAVARSDAAAPPLLRVATARGASHGLVRPEATRCWRRGASGRAPPITWWRAARCCGRPRRMSGSCGWTSRCSDRRRRCARGCCRGGGAAELAFCSFRAATSPPRPFVQVGGRGRPEARRPARSSACRPGVGRTRQAARWARFRLGGNSRLFDTVGFGILEVPGALGVFRFVSILPRSPAAPSRDAAKDRRGLGYRGGRGGRTCSMVRSAAASTRVRVRR